MDIIAASGEVLKVYQTGDRPILVLCADGFHYICKYKQPGYAANKLVSELIGSEFARIWRIATPHNALIINDPIIWDDKGITHDLSAPLWGSRKMDSVFDISDINSSQIKYSFKTLHQFLVIALFDMWIANEDRTCNNYNLLFDMKQERIVSIDYGGIFNSNIISNPLFQLNAHDSIISSNLFDSLSRAGVESVLNTIRFTYLNNIRNCKLFAKTVLDMVPKDWDVDISAFEGKVNELFGVSWVNEVWSNYQSIIKGE